MALGPQSLPLSITLSPFQLYIEKKVIDLKRINICVPRKMAQPVSWKTNAFGVIEKPPTLYTLGRTPRAEDIRSAAAQHRSTLDRAFDKIDASIVHRIKAAVLRDKTVKGITFVVPDEIFGIAWFDRDELLARIYQEFKKRNYNVFAMPPYQRLSNFDREPEEYKYTLIINWDDTVTEKGEPKTRFGNTIFYAPPKT